MPLVLERPPSDTNRPNRGDTGDQSTINPDYIDPPYVLSRPAVQKRKKLDVSLPRLDIKRRIHGLIRSLRARSNLRRMKTPPQLTQSSGSFSLQNIAMATSFPPPHVTVRQTTAPTPSRPGANESPVLSSQPPRRVRSRKASGPE